MDLRELLPGYIQRVRELHEHVRGNEQATKQSLIGPLFTLLGYDLTDPRECMPEYRADFGTGRSKAPVDWAFLTNGKPIFFVEAKSAGTNLDGYNEQLADYFAKELGVKLGILTNGVEWRFFSDSENPNVMDRAPFATWNVLRGVPPYKVLNALLKGGESHPRDHEAEQPQDPVLYRLSGCVSMMGGAALELDTDKKPICLMYSGKEKLIPESCIMYIGKSGQTADKKLSTSAILAILEEALAPEEWLQLCTTGSMCTAPALERALSPAEWYQLQLPGSLHASHKTWDGKEQDIYAEWEDGRIHVEMPSSDSTDRIYELGAGYGEGSDGSTDAMFAYIAAADSSVPSTRAKLVAVLERIGVFTRLQAALGEVRPTAHSAPFSETVETDHGSLLLSSPYVPVHFAESETLVLWRICLDPARPSLVFAFGPEQAHSWIAAGAAEILPLALPNWCEVRLRSWDDLPALSKLLCAAHDFLRARNPMR